MKVRIGKQLAGFLFVTLLAIFGSIISYAKSANKSFTIEDVVFKTNVVPDTTNDKSVEILAKLYMPKNVNTPISAVVISPSSGGVEKDREIYYAKRLAKSGIAALIVDSFKSRELTNSIYDQSLLEAWQMVNDAFGALIFLSNDERFLSEKIGIMGGSKGGSVAMDAAHKIIREWANLEEVAFAAHVAITPDCNWTTRSNKTTGAPVFFMLAELDDQTSVDACINKANRLSKAGNKKIKTTVYKGAHHAWEELGSKPVFDPKAENYSGCRVWVEENGKMKDVVTNENIPEDEWYSWATENCKKLGAHCCGGTKELKEKATRDIITFFRWYGF